MLSDVTTSLLVCVVKLSARPPPTTLLSPSSDGKPEVATAVVVAPDDGHDDTRNLLSCLDGCLTVHLSITFGLISNLMH